MSKRPREDDDGDTPNVPPLPSIRAIPSRPAVGHLAPVLSNPPPHAPLDAPVLPNPPPVIGKPFQRPVCCYFLEGKCKNGDSCRFAHKDDGQLCSFGEKCHREHDKRHEPGHKEKMDRLQNSKKSKKIKVVFDAGKQQQMIVKIFRQHKKKFDLFAENRSDGPDGVDFGLAFALANGDPMEMMMYGMMGAITGGGGGSRGRPAGMWVDMKKSLEFFKKINRGDITRKSKTPNRVLPAAVYSSTEGFLSESQAKVARAYLDAGGFFIYSQDIDQPTLDILGVSHWKKGPTELRSGKFTTLGVEQLRPKTTVLTSKFTWLRDVPADEALHVDAEDASFTGAAIHRFESGGMLLYFGEINATKAAAELWASFIMKHLTPPK